MRYLKSKKALTFIELIIVVTIISIISSFAIPNLEKSISRNRERTIIAGLHGIHAALKMDRARSGTGLFMTSGGGWLGQGEDGTGALGTALDINIPGDKIDYHYTCTNGINCRIHGADRTYNYEVEIETWNPIGPNNPCCISGNPCPTRPAC